jgi:hypothetical protein
MRGTSDAKPKYARIAYLLCAIANCQLPARRAVFGDADSDMLQAEVIGR